MADIYLHNTMTGKKELFKPLEEGKVSIYNCGPTVYNYAHIGNFRTYVFGDVLRRTFEYNGYAVSQVMNITDVDDKTIRGSKQSGISLKEFTRKYEDIFKIELAELHVLTPSKMPRATESIDEMISLIEMLIDKGIGYVTSDGVYFSIKKSAGYGTLAQLNLRCDDEGHDHSITAAESTADAANEAKGHRVAKDEYEKDDAQDFALWKFYVEEDGDVFWEAPFGRGRPGWHIECSAMAMKALGPTIDIHTGASDLIFPHHTNEIAQSEGVTGKTFVNTWLHAGFLNVDSKKMAKSAGNFYTLPVLKEKGISPLAYRYWLLTAHYRTQINFTEESVLAAGVALGRFMDAVVQVGRAASSALETGSGAADPKYSADFKAAINDDLNVSKALALAWDLLKDKSIEPDAKLATLLEFDHVFGFGLAEHLESTADSAKPIADVELPADILNLVTERRTARADKNWKRSDELRDALKEAGYSAVDNSDGQHIFKV